MVKKGILRSIEKENTTCSITRVAAPVMKIYDSTLNEGDQTVH